MRLRELRNAAGLSLRDLARAVPCSHVYLWELEHGRKAPSRELLRRLDEVLSAGGELSTHPRGERADAASHQAGWVPRRERFGKRDAEALAIALIAAAPSPVNALRLAHEWLLTEPPQVYEVRSGRRIGESTVAHVEQRVHHLRLLDDHVGGIDSYRAVSAELSATANLLREASYTETVGRRLLAAVGELAQLAGWVASDAGRYAQAEHHYLTGAWAAQAGGDTAGAANNLSSLAYQMANVANPYDAVVLARTAVCRAERAAATTPLAKALLQERAAWAHARAGEATACERTLGLVADAYSSRRSEADPPWAYWLDTAEVEIMAGRCWTELGRPLRAVPILRDATAEYGDDRPRETALYISWLAEALLQAGEAEEAAATALRVLTLARRTRSGRVGERIALLQKRLHPLRGLRVVDEFENKLRETR